MFKSWLCMFVPGAKASQQNYPGKLTMCMDAVVFDALDLTQHRMYILYIHSKIFLECECVTKLQECVDH